MLRAMSYKPSFSRIFATGMEAQLMHNLAMELEDARRNRAQVAPLTDRFKEISIGDAYRIQQTLLELRQTSGAHLLGRKIGLTSIAIQTALGVSEPDYGHLLSDMHVFTRDAVQLQSLIQPRAEGEIAFVLERDLDMPFVTEADVLRCTAFVMPAIEIIDSRIRDWKIKLEDTVADNASSALFVIGSRKTPIDNLDLCALGMSLYRNGSISATGSGAAALGSPAKAVAWLANALHAHGVTMRAGEIILSGGLAATVTPSKGDWIEVEMERLGNVSVRFE